MIETNVTSPNSPYLDKFTVIFQLHIWNSLLKNKIKKVDHFSKKIYTWIKRTKTFTLSISTFSRSHENTVLIMIVFFTVVNECYSWNPDLFISAYYMKSTSTRPNIKHSSHSISEFKTMHFLIFWLLKHCFICSEIACKS